MQDVQSLSIDLWINMFYLVVTLDLVLWCAQISCMHELNVGQTFGLFYSSISIALFYNNHTTVSNKSTTTMVQGSYFLFCPTAAAQFPTCPNCSVLKL